MASLSVKTVIRREGLIFTIFAEGGRVIAVVNMQDQLGLTDEEAKALLTKLDEQKAEKPC